MIKPKSNCTVFRLITTVAVLRGSVALSTQVAETYSAVWFILVLKGKYSLCMTYVTMRSYNSVKLVISSKVIKILKVLLPKRVYQIALPVLQTKTLLLFMKSQGSL